MPCGQPSFEAGQLLMPETEAETQQVDFPFGSCQVAHAIRGRVRLRQMAEFGNEDLARAADLFGKTSRHPARALQSAGGSVVVDYDPVTWDAQSLALLDQRHTIRSRKNFTHFGRKYRPHPSTIRQSQKEVMVAGSALLLQPDRWPGGTAGGDYSGSVRAPSSNAPTTLLHDRKLTVESLDAAAISVLTLQGMFWQVVAQPHAFQR